MTVEILKSDLDIFEKMAALMGVDIIKHDSIGELILLDLTEDGNELDALTAYYLATNFQLEIRRLTLEKVLTN